MRISGTTKVLALLGNPVEHSMSPAMHNAAIKELGLDYRYVCFHVHPERLKEAVDGIRAFDINCNVTIPYKVDIMQYLDEIDETAQKLGAINTIKNDNGFLRAKNTDGEGALKAIKDRGGNPKGKKVVCLGAGGAARAISYFLLTEANEFVLVNREEDFHLAETLRDRLKDNYDNTISAIKSSESDIVKKEISEADILVNCTPVGMYPKMGVSPIPAEWLHSDLFVFDAIYNPLKTQLLQDAESLGCKIETGVMMLVNQGWLAFKWWTGKEPNSELMRNKVIEHLGIKE